MLTSPFFTPFRSIIYVSLLEHRNARQYYPLIYFCVLTFRLWRAYKRRRHALNPKKMSGEDQSLFPKLSEHEKMKERKVNKE